MLLVSETGKYGIRKSVCMCIAEFHYKVNCNALFYFRFITEKTQGVRQTTS